MNKNQSNTGSTLVEVMVVIVLMGLLSIPLMASLNNLNSHYRRIATYDQAAYLTRSNLEVLTNLVNHNWKLIDRPETQGLDIMFGSPYHLEKHIEWELIDGKKVEGPYETWIEFQPLCRADDNKPVICTPNNTSEASSDSVRVVSTTSWKYKNRQEMVTYDTILTYLF